METFDARVLFKNNMKQLIFLALSAFLFSCNQNSSAGIKNHDQDSIKYVHESIAFLNAVVGKEHVIEDKPVDITYCIKEVLTDKSSFTAEEIELIQQKKYIPDSRWTKDAFPDFKLISSDSVNAMFKRYNEGRDYSNIGESYYSFSKPIFLRGYSYCLFFSQNRGCGGRCSWGRLSLYRKVYTNWVEIKFYCGWIT
jgi:hypothetical protein